MLLFPNNQNSLAGNDGQVKYILADSASYCIITCGEKPSDVVKIQTFDTSLKGAHEEQAETVVFISSSPAFTLLPSVLFDYEKLDTITEFAFSDADEHHYLSQKGVDQQITFIWGEKKQRIEQLGTVFPGVQHQHISQWMYNFLFSAGKKDVLLILPLNNVVYIGLLLEGKCQIINQYDARKEDEIMYYVLMIVQEYGVSQEDIQVTVINPNVSEKLTALLQTYFRHIDIKPQQEWSSVDATAVLNLL